MSPPARFGRGGLPAPYFRGHRPRDRVSGVPTPARWPTETNRRPIVGLESPPLVESGHALRVRWTSPTSRSRSLSALTAQQAPTRRTGRHGPGRGCGLGRPPQGRTPAVDFRASVMRTSPGEYTKWELTLGPRPPRSCTSSARLISERSGRPLPIPLRLRPWSSPHHENEYRPSRGRRAPPPSRRDLDAPRDDRDGRTRRWSKSADSNIFQLFPGAFRIVTAGGGLAYLNLLVTNRQRLAFWGRARCVHAQASGFERFCGIFFREKRKRW